MESRIASRSSNDNHRQHVLLLKRKSYSHTENTWEIYKLDKETLKEVFSENYFKNAMIEQDGWFIKKMKMIKYFLFLC